MKNKISSIKILMIGCLCMIFAVGVNAQESSLGNWLIYIGNKKIDNRWNIHSEAQYRNYNAIGDLEQLLLRTGVGYNLTEGGNNLLLGYGFINSQNYVNTDEKVSINEHRIFQQFITRQKIGKVGLQHRYRFEQRFIEDSDIRLRFRYFLGINAPLIEVNDGKNPIYLSIYNEIFINTVANVFDRNRLYGGIGYKINDNLKVELGYMNQFLNGGSRDQVNIFAFVNF